MDQNQRWEQLARMNEAAGPPAPRSTPKLGRAALAVALLAVVLFLLTASNGFPTPATSLVARQVIVVAGPAIGVGLAIASLVRKERKAPAVATLTILLAAPLLVYLMTVIAWWGYAQGLGS
ncbi:MAG: hypothetical protein KA158_02845 [Leucobacter sp.]|nr:hypothetical protein [Leucobacter sp.]